MFVVALFLVTNIWMGVHHTIDFYDKNSALPQLFLSSATVATTLSIVFTWQYFQGMNLSSGFSRRITLSSLLSDESLDIIRLGFTWGNFNMISMWVIFMIITTSSHMCFVKIQNNVHMMTTNYMHTTSLEL
jgi:hypothetical protein